MLLSLLTQHMVPPSISGAVVSATPAALMGSARYIHGWSIRSDNVLLFESRLVALLALT